MPASSGKKHACQNFRSWIDLKDTARIQIFPSIRL
ncbi:hypothetical protein MXB_5697 [Myxobolus squamalis]|nr:hypothetical protein MXB_5697 [Myxobolus squamalis]